MPDQQSELVLQEQLDYYRARAGEYDQWWYRYGRYDRGLAENAQWFTEIAEVRRALRSIGRVDSVLELACGTGIWTEELVNLGRRVTALDASPEVIAINQARIANPKATYLQADLFSWRPAEQYDLAFTSFWLSHVPPERFHQFLATVRAALKPRGLFFVLDSLREITSTARDQQLPDEDDIYAKRRLNDGREFTIVKIFYEPASLTAALTDAGFRANVRQTPRYFIYGAASIDEREARTQ